MFRFPLASTLLAFSLLPLATHADSVGVPNTFLNGTPADADQVNANFDAVESAVNDNDARIGSVEGGVTTNAANIASETVRAAFAESANAMDIANETTRAQAAEQANAAAAASSQGTADSNTTAISANAALISTIQAEVGGIVDASAEIAALQDQVALFQAYFLTLCGNGAIETTFETCDDSGAANGDGCSDSCSIEPGSVCSGEPSDCSDGTRFEACSDGLTIADPETGLLWERKTSGSGDLHDVSNTYTWSSTGTAADGTAYTVFLAALNAGAGFAGHTNWRLPSISELQSILIGQDVILVAAADPPDPASGTNPTGQATTCNNIPCFDPGFAAVGGPTAVSDYWSASSSPTIPVRAWMASAGNGHLNIGYKTVDSVVRAVRAGSCSS